MPDAEKQLTPARPAPTDPPPDASFIERLAGASKWAIGIFGTAGAFAVANFAFNELGKRPVVLPDDQELDILAWPGGDGWALIGTGVFALGLVLLTASILSVRRADRVSMSYLTGRSAPGSTRRAVQHAIRRSPHLAQVPRANYQLLKQLTDELRRTHEVFAPELFEAIEAASQAAARHWQTNVADDALSAIRIVHGTSLAEDIASDADSESAASRTKKALDEASIEQYLIATSEPATVSGPPTHLIGNLQALNVPGDVRDSLTNTLQNWSSSVSRSVDRIAHPLAIETGRTPHEVADLIRAAATKHADVASTVALGGLSGELRAALAPELLDANDVAEGYARAIRRGDRQQAAFFKQVTRTIIETSRNERVQITAARNAIAVPLAALLTAVGASLFVFTVQSAGLLRDTQVALDAQQREDELRIAAEGREDELRTATERREDALRLLDESIEGTVVVGTPTTAILRVPIALDPTDPWVQSLEESCRVVAAGPENPAQPRSIDAVVLGYGAPSSDDLIARQNGAPDPNAVIRIATVPSVECPGSVDGWVPDDWVLASAPSVGQAD